MGKPSWPRNGWEVCGKRGIGRRLSSAPCPRLETTIGSLFEFLLLDFWEVHFGVCIRKSDFFELIHSGSELVTVIPTHWVWSFPPYPYLYIKRIGASILTLVCTCSLPDFACLFSRFAFLLNYSLSLLFLAFFLNFPFQPASSCSGSVCFATGGFPSSAGRSWIQGGRDMGVK